MGYECELGNGQRLLVENEGGNTLVALSSDGGSQQQSQATGFDTGKWTKPPSLFRVGKDFILRLETGEGAQFLRIRGSQIQRSRDEPDLKKAEKLRLKKSDEAAGMKPIKAMEPMKPMKPMEPMKPMRGMRPMEMHMGDMHMSMGSEKAAPASRFCTQCGHAAHEEDRFCRSCGRPLGGKKP